jgi:sugar transferase (PEP-CTERM/EpsH1 system associated)
MKVLWVKSGGLMPPDTGGKIRSLSIARELARLHEVTLFTFYPRVENDENPSLRSVFHDAVCLPIDLPERQSASDYLDYAANLLTRRPYQMSKYCRPEVAEQLNAYLQKNHFDAIICDFLLTAGVIPWENKIPTIIFTHNVEATIWRRHFEVSTNPFWKVMSWREFKTMERAERLYLEKADHVLTVSEADKNDFAKFLDPRKITVIPTGVDTDYFKPQSGPTNAGSMVFTGSMDWLPNDDAIAYFAEAIMPLIRKQVPEAKLWVVGRRPTQRLKQLAERDGSIRVTGGVEDIRPYVRDCAVYVVPLRIGGGTRIKIFEAMGMGKAVVSTTIGAEGLPVEDGTHIRLADDPESFARETITLLQDTAAASALGQNARKLVEENYGWQSVTRVLDDVLRRATKNDVATSAIAR